MAGLVVDQILDIHDESIQIGTTGTQPRLSGSAVLGGKVTDFLDLPAVLRAAEQGWNNDSSPRKNGRVPILVADPSTFSRALVRNYLELAGYPVLEAVDASEALAKLERHSVGVVVSSLPLEDAKQLKEELRKRPGANQIPIVTPTDGEAGTVAVDRFDREALLESLQNLSAALEEQTASLAVRS